MTGRELIVYILQHNLEDKPIFTDGKLIGFMNKLEAAARLNVGVASIDAMTKREMIDHICISGVTYIPATFEVSEGGENE